MRQLPVLAHASEGWKCRDCNPPTVSQMSDAETISLSGNTKPLPRQQIALEAVLSRYGATVEGHRTRDALAQADVADYEDLTNPRHMNNFIRSLELGGILAKEGIEKTRGR